MQAICGVCVICFPGALTVVLEPIWVSQCEYKVGELAPLKFGDELLVLIMAKLARVVFEDGLCRFARRGVEQHDRGDIVLLKLLGIQKVEFNTFVKRLQTPSTYFVHCDLIDKKQNLLNGKPSTVLASFDVRGQPFEKVHYQTPQPHVLRDAASGDYDVNSITLSVQDENGNLFDFNSQPLEFEVEIN